jgi:hypothetical protein
MGTHPREWDGRVREVVSTRRVLGSNGYPSTFLTLECGHQAVRTGPKGGVGGVERVVCPACPTWRGLHSGNTNRIELREGGR